MKWGVRRYQNKDGTLTNAGKARKKSNTSASIKKTANTVADTLRRVYGTKAIVDASYAVGTILSSALKNKRIADVTADPEVKKTVTETINSLSKWGLYNNMEELTK